MADERNERIAEFIEPFRVAPGSRVSLERDFDPAFKAGIKKKKRGVNLLGEGVELLTEFQMRLAAQDTHGVLVVLQALDAAGKDGTIRHVMSGVNPQGVSVHSFKAPSAEELNHDFLWRYQQRMPRPGRDRHLQPLALRGGARGPRASREPSAGEDALGRQGQERVAAALPGDQRLGALPGRQRHEDREALPQPLQGGAAHSAAERCDLPDHNWKFSVNDVRERQCWDDYQKAFSEMLSHTSTHWAPWYVIPADRKWFARIAAASVIVDALMSIDPQFPTVDAAARAELAGAKAELEAQAPAGAAADPFVEAS
jgi:polyphosphate kinase 2 (PPK2 family)